MNSVALLGRLTADPKITYTQAPESRAIARYTLAVDRMRTGPDGKKEADFINCVAFRNVAEFAEKYLHKGSKIAVTGSIQTGSYTNREGQKVFTTEVVVNSQEFAESRQQAPQQAPQPQPTNYQLAPGATAYRPAQAPQQDGNWSQAKPREGLPDGWMDVPDNLDDAGLPWN